VTPAAPPAPKRPPRLVLRFAVYSAIALALAWLAIFWLIRREAEERGREQVTAHATNVADRAAASLTDADFAGPVPEPRRAELDAVFERELVGNLVRIKLWSPEGVVTYATDHGLIGERSSDAEELEAPLAGQTTQQVSSLNDDSAGAEGEDAKAFESYVPLLVGNGQRPAGVLEVYEAYEPVAAEIEETVTPIGIALGLALLLLYATLFPILRQVTKALDNRHRGLEQHATALAQALEERDKAEVRVSQAERNYRSLVEQLPLVMYITRLDRTSSCIYMSPQIEGLAGYTPLECMSDPEFFVKILHPDDRERTLALHEQAFASGESFSTTYRLVAKDGSAVWVHDELTIAVDPSGRPLHAQGFLIDITESKAAEETRARLAAIVESSNDAITSASLDLRYTSWNDGAERMFGHSAEQMLGRPLTALMPEERREEALGVLRRVMADGRVGHLETVRTGEDGSPVYVAFTYSPIRDSSGKVVGVSAIGQDITQRKRAETDRERLLQAEQEARALAEAAQRDLFAQNERLRELDRLKDEFIALISHELRTPLTSIRGYTELLLDGEAGDLTDDQRQFLGVVERNSHRLLHLVGDLLFLAQLEAGKLSLEIGELDLAAVASESVETARPQAEAKGITLTLATGPVPSLAGDRARIAQLLDNLVSNAVKFTPEGGRVDVRVRRHEDQAILEVRDSGMGIPPEEQELLFERFFRTSTATEQAIQGTGLGLAISKAIVEAHSGRIAVSSDEGAGTTFRVTLPLRQAAEVRERAEVAS
jgi:PAS domain S-box-containing protein